MKKFLLLFLAFILCFSVISCQKENELPENNGEGITEPEILQSNYPDFLYMHDWVKYNEEGNEYITFTKYGKFTYTSEGTKESYGAYTKYIYHKDKNKIEFLGNDISEFADLVYYDEYYLLMNFENSGLAVFLNEKFTENEFAPHESMDVYASQGWVYLTVIGYNDEIIQLAPYDYDKDSFDLFEPYIRLIEHNNDISFSFVGSVTENGETIKKHYEFDQNKKDAIGDYYTVAFLHFNNEAEIDQGVFYGSLEILDSEIPEENDRIIY